jgi:DNA-binding MarR family transcriptional regulator
VLIAITDLGRATVEADRERRDAWLAQRLGDLSADERAVLRATVPIFERIANE